jgi:1,4-dihydroxy-2-naphthoyl-CoA hydrolase
MLQRYAVRKQIALSRSAAKCQAGTNSGSFYSHQTLSRNFEFVLLYLRSMIFDLKQANALSASTLLGALGMEFTVLQEGYVEATMPVDQRTHQPYGLLHGGASAALAETLGSYGSALLVHAEGGIAVGVELNINHIKSKRSGHVIGCAKLIHRGSNTHVWNIEIVDEERRLLALSRLTVLIKKSKSNG